MGYYNRKNGHQIRWETWCAEDLASTDLRRAKSCPKRAESHQAGVIKITVKWQRKWTPSRSGLYRWKFISNASLLYCDVQVLWSSGRRGVECSGPKFENQKINSWRIGTPYVMVFLHRSIRHTSHLRPAMIFSTPHFTEPVSRSRLARNKEREDDNRLDESLLSSYWRIKSQISSLMSFFFSVSSPRASWYLCYGEYTYLGRQILDGIKASPWHFGRRYGASYRACLDYKNRTSVIRQTPSATDDQWHLRTVSLWNT